jgi:HK97 family phage prohead protease
MNKEIQFKTFSLKLDDVDSQGTIRGYASTFGNVDLGFDVVDKGAFKKSIKENGGKFPILADHNPSDQIGWNFRAEEDEMGLFVEGKIDLNVQKGREKYSLAKTALTLGAKMGLSIGYMTIKAEPDREKPMVRRLKELKLFEYSIVTFPMNTEAMVTGAKSLAGVDMASYMITELIKQGISKDDLQKALRTEAAPKLEDPSQMIQSYKMMIDSMKA